MFWSLAVFALVDGETQPPLYRCVVAAPNMTRLYAYAVMVGPVSAERKYGKWLYPILALRRALIKAGSRADLLVLAAVDACCEADRMLASEEAMLAAQDVRLRYVPAPAGIRGFHMGHYKLWAWQHTEYARIQLLDADVLPLVDMDSLFHIPVDSDFVGCPGRSSVLNAGWFSLRPDCDHFKNLVDLLFDRAPRKGHRWDDQRGWGVSIPQWRNAEGRTIPEGHDFFDAKGNQGHMYSYFRFYANDLTLVYSDQVEAFVPVQKTSGSHLTPDNARHLILATERDLVANNRDDRDAAARIARAVYQAFPCPFTLRGDVDLPVAYHHFTGNVKPWTVYNPADTRFAQWYAVLADIGIDVQATLFNNSSLEEEEEDVSLLRAKPRRRRRRRRQRHRREVHAAVLARSIRRHR